jgi:hypothetical protein
VVTTEDPGAEPHALGQPVLNNLNRQLVTSRAGLVAATRQFAIKLRSDQYIEHTAFLDLFQSFNRPSKGCFFEHPVVGCTVYSINPRRWQPLPFHPGDMFHFGLRTDLLELWSAPLSNEPETTRWFEKHSLPSNLVLPWSKMRFAPEQWLWLSFLRRHSRVDCADAFDLGHENLELSEMSIACNLILADPETLGLNLGERHPYPNLLPGCYSEGEWRSLHSRYALGRWKPAIDAASLRRKGSSKRILWGARVFHHLNRLRVRIGAWRRVKRLTNPKPGTLS